MKTSNPLKRDRYTSPLKKPISAIPMIPGDGLKDVLSGVSSTCVISGTRYGIVNGIVTQFAVNQPSIEDYGLRCCPAFTQLAQKTEDLSTWSKTASTVSVDGLIRGVNRLLIADTNVTGAHYIERDTPFGTVTDNTYTNISCVAKYNGRNLRLYILTKNNLAKTIFFDLKNGNIYSQESNTFASMIPLGNGYYRCFFSVLHGTGATTIASNILLTNDSFNTSYAGDASKGIFISELSYTNTTIPFIPPYVPNNTSGSISYVSEAATATTGVSFDLDDVKLARLKTALRGPNAQGHLELDLLLNFNKEWKTTNTQIISVNNDPTGDFLYYAVSGLGWSMYDTAANKATSAMSSFSVGQSIKFVLDWGSHSTGQKMRITVNGVKSALANFSGSFGTQDMRFFYNNTVHAGWIKKDSLKIFDRPRW